MCYHGQFWHRISQYAAVATKNKKLPVWQLSVFRFPTLNRPVRGYHMHSMCSCIMDRQFGSRASMQWVIHYDVIKWKHFSRCWPFVRGIHRSPVDSPRKGPVTRALLSNSGLIGWPVPTLLWRSCHSISVQMINLVGCVMSWLGAGWVPCSPSMHSPAGQLATDNGGWDFTVWPSLR